MALIGEIAVNVVARTGQFTKGLAAARKHAVAFGAGMIALGSAATAGFGAAIKIASDFQETMSKFDVVFGESSKAVQAWSENFASQVGRSRNQIAGMLASTQDLFVPMGFAADEALKMSQNMTKLAVDLGSFNNVADDTVILDLHRALTGGGEVMKKYGVVLDEVTTKQELLNMRIDPSKATTYEKVMARLNIIMRGTAAAQGDAIRTADGFANQMKRLQGNIADTAATIGTVLLPAATQIVERVGVIVSSVAQWVARNEGLVMVLAQVSVAAIAVGIPLAGLNKIVLLLSGSVKALTAALVLLTKNPLVLLGASLGLVVVKVLDSVGVFDSLTNSLFGVGDAAKDAAAGVGKLNQQLSENSAQAIEARIQQYKKTIDQLEGLLALSRGGGGTQGEPASVKIQRDLQNLRGQLKAAERDLFILGGPERRAAAEAEAARKAQEPRTKLLGNLLGIGAAREFSQGIRSVATTLFGGRTDAGLSGHPILGQITQVFEAITKLPTEMEHVTRSQNAIIQKGTQEAIAFAAQHRERERGTPEKKIEKNTAETVKEIKSGFKSVVNAISQGFGGEQVFSISAS